jgi:2-polyprenyl-6-methoxyphenol hydroxylase-like FAD-dependent oxidoreductase
MPTPRRQPEDGGLLIRESLQFDVVIVGAGPAGLSAACKLVQLSKAKGLDLSIAVVEKGAAAARQLRQPRREL